MKVSVIIPARNAQSTLGATLASIAAQSWLPEEVIVVDDQSDDATAAVARSHPIVSQVLAGTGLGPAAALNTAAHHAVGEWLAPLDADDLWPPDRLAQGLTLADQSEASVVIGIVETFLDDAHAVQVTDGLRYQLGRKTGFLPGAALIRRDAFLALAGFNGSLRTGFFIDFWDRLTRSDYSVAEGDFVALLRRIRPGSLSHRTGSNRAAMERDFLAIARDAIRRRR